MKEPVEIIVTIARDDGEVLGRSSRRMALATDLLQGSGLHATGGQDAYSHLIGTLGVEAYMEAFPRSAE